MASRKRGHSAMVASNRVDNFCESDDEIPYKKRIVSEFDQKDPRFWQEEDLVFKSGNVDIRASYDDLKNVPAIYFRREYPQKEGKKPHTYKPSIVALEKKNVRSLIDWVNIQAEALDEIEHPKMLAKLEKLGDEGLVQRGKNGLAPNFFDGGEMLELGDFRIKIAFDEVCAGHKYFMNNPGRHESYVSWNGPTIELTHGALLRICSHLKYLDGLF